MLAAGKREQLEGVSTLEHVVELLRSRKRIIVISGAGISVSCGIPDFRSKEHGLYNKLDCAKFGIPSAELLFDLEFFEIDPQPFYRFASSLLPNDVQPSLAHKFLGVLAQKKKLLRNYTQNVDGLERKVAALNHSKQVVECHGSMAGFKCIKCKYKADLNDALAEEVRHGNVIYCGSKSCTEVMKPNITFFGEALPKSLYTAINKDLPLCDLVIVIGTSLKVGGSVMEILKRIDPSVPQILINKEGVKLPAFSAGFDVSLLGQCDDVVHMLCALLGWRDVDSSSSSSSSQAAPVGSSGLGEKRKRNDDGAEAAGEQALRFVQESPRVYCVVSQAAATAAAEGGEER
jgi:NAD-dependent deacetylase sirtuin 1